MSQATQSTHAQWGSRLGFILAATGSAVGLGNVWKFPYMVGTNGGSAFVLSYLVCVALVGFPILIAEWIVGRRGQCNPYDSALKVAKSNNRTKLWSIIGITGILASFLLLSFYSVIGGWAVDYIFQSGTGAFSGLDAKGSSALFGALQASPSHLLIWHTIFMALTVIIVAFGVTSGLERATKIMMPGLFIILIVIVGYDIVVSGTMMKTLAYMFAPNWKQALSGQVLLSALGHAFFTLSLGMGIMISYGSYLGEEINLLKTARTVVILDTVVALIAGIAIFPMVFATPGLVPSAGPGLVFVTLPIAFGHMPLGSILGVLFFVLLTFAALTSSISLLEPTVELLQDKMKLPRVLASIVAGIPIWALGILCLLSFNVLSHWKIFGDTIFDLLDNLTTNYMLPLTGLATIIFVGWFVNRRSVEDELGFEQGSDGMCAWRVVTRYIAPVLITIVFVAGLYH